MTHPSLQLEANDRICSYFGLADYILMTPVTSTDTLTTESKRQQLLGALHVALGQAKCRLPIVLQYHDVSAVIDGDDDRAGLAARVLRRRRQLVHDGADDVRARAPLSDALRALERPH